MAKKKQHQPVRTRQAADENQSSGTTLKDLLRPDVLDKLKGQAASMKAEEERKREEARKQAEEARVVEQKRRENDFAYLLENSSVDWKKHKS